MTLSFCGWTHGDMGGFGWALVGIWVDMWGFWMDLDGDLWGFVGICGDLWGFGLIVRPPVSGRMYTTNPHKSP